jgi:Rrf2 family protein
VAAKALAARHDLPPRHLETLLQALVRANILKGVRGPRGGYELARERRRISMADIVRAALNEGDEEASGASSRVLNEIVTPLALEAGQQFLSSLEAISLEDLCKKAEAAEVFGPTEPVSDFTI